MAMRYEISRLVLKKIFNYSKRNFVSPSDHVMFYIHYITTNEMPNHFRACLHGGGGPQIGEVTCGGSPNLWCKRDQIKMGDYVGRRATHQSGLPHLPGVPHLHQRCDLLWSHSNGDIFTCEDNMLFSHVKISSFRATAHLVFHWCLCTNSLIICMLWITF